MHSHLFLYKVQHWFSAYPNNFGFQLTHQLYFEYSNIHQWHWLEWMTIETSSASLKYIKLRVHSTASLNQNEDLVANLIIYLWVFSQKAINCWTQWQKFEPTLYNWQLKVKMNVYSFNSQWCRPLSLYGVSCKTKDMNECTLPITNNLPSLYDMFLENYKYNRELEWMSNMMNNPFVICFYSSIKAYSNNVPSLTISFEN